MKPIRPHLSLAKATLEALHNGVVDLTPEIRAAILGLKSSGGQVWCQEESTSARQYPRASRGSECGNSSLYTTANRRVEFALAHRSSSATSGKEEKAHSLPSPRPSTESTINVAANSAVRRRRHHLHPQVSPRALPNGNFPTVGFCAKSSPLCKVTPLRMFVVSRQTSCQRRYFGSDPRQQIISNKCNILSSFTCDIGKSYLIGNRLYHPTRPMLSDVFTRFMSSVQKGASSLSSGTPIEISEEENLLSDSKGNKRININACGELYTRLAKSRPDLFASAPQGKGIDFEVRYYDSVDLLSGDAKFRAPTICLLHGAPGKYQEFAGQINYFTRKGFRVVAPNFPDYSATFNYSFRHSPPERLDLLLEFFRAIELKRIDMLVGHSSAVYTMMELLEYSLNDAKKLSKSIPIQIKSLGLFSTPTYNLPPNLAATPFRLFTLKLFDYPFLRPIIMSLIHTFVKFQGIRNRVDKDRIDNLLIAASAVGYSNSEKTRDQLDLIRRRKVPTYVLVGCNDKLIPMRSFEQLKRDLGVIDDKQIRQYNKNGELRQDLKELNDMVEVSQFDFGGHYAFQRYSRQVNEDMLRFLNRKVLRTSGEESVTKL